MKPQQILILGILLLLLIVTVFIKQTRKPPELATEEYLPLDLSFDPSKVEKAQIGKGGISSFTVVKGEGGIWRIPDFLNARADQKKIDDLLKEIRETKGELRARDKALFPDFEIDEKQAFQVSLLDQSGANLLSLYIGNKLAGDNLLFVRRDDSNEVFVAEANMLTSIGINGKPSEEKPKADYWAATNLVKLEIDKVEKLQTRRFSNGKEIWTAGILRAPELTDSARKRWKYVREEIPFSPDAEKIKQFLNSLNSWHATKVLVPTAKDYGFSKPFWQMRVGFKEGQEIVLTASVLDSESKAHFLQVSSEPVVFQLPDDSFRNLDIDDSKFFVDDPLAVHSEKTERLVIHAGNREMKFSPKEKKSDVLTSYLNDLKTFSVVRLLFDASEQGKAKSGGGYRLEIQKEASAPQVLRVGALLSGPDKHYAAQMENNTQPFAISEAVFKKLFDNLDRLSESKN